MSYELYAAGIQSEFISMVKANLRDSSSSVLAPFWTNPPSPGTEEVAERYDASVVFRTANNLLRISDGDFVGQVLPDKSQLFFEEFVDAMGIEKVYVEDMYLESPEARVPEVPGLTETIRVLMAKGYTFDRDALEASYPSADLSEDPVYHIDEPDPALFAEEDSIVAGKMAKGRIYTSLYVEKNQGG